MKYRLLGGLVVVWTGSYGQDTVTIYRYPLNWIGEIGCDVISSKAIIHHNTLRVLDSMGGNYYPANGFYSFRNKCILICGSAPVRSEEEIQAERKDTIRAYCNGKPCDGVQTFLDTPNLVVLSKARFIDGSIDASYSYIAYRKGKRVLKVRLPYKKYWEYEEDGNYPGKTVLKRHWIGDKETGGYRFTSYHSITDRLMQFINRILRPFTKKPPIASLHNSL